MLLLVAHGSTTSPVAAETVDRHAAALRRSDLAADVRVAMLRGEPALEAVVAGLPDSAGVVVLPMMMTDGVLSREELPQRLQAALTETDKSIGTPVLLPPLGTGAAFAQLVLQRAQEAARERPGGEGGHALLLIAHGNAADPQGRRSIERLAAMVRADGAFADVAIAFLEEAPTIIDALAAIRLPVVAVGLFAAEGRHARLDVPRLLAQAPDGQSVVWLGALGADAALPGVLNAHVSASLESGRTTERSRAAQSSSASSCAEG